MCGILGVVSLRPGLDIDGLGEARDILHHRGPNGGATWQSARTGGPAVALAHRRLSILDLSEHADQPLLRTGRQASRPARDREEGGSDLALLYNGEIYNYVELRRELESLGHAFASTGDTEVLIAAYAEWSDRCVERLNGMFSFAIWDAPRRRLFGARDRFGEKPFHYVIDAKRGVFAFASEIKALLVLGAASGQLNDRALYRYLHFGEQAGVVETLWEGVNRLPAATAFVVESQNGALEMRTWRYWSVDFTADPINTHLSFDQAASEFRSIFADSVKIRLRSDVPVGTSLSGGLDSSSVLCQIAAIGAAAGQKAFTARMDDPALDEGRYVDALLTRVGIPGFSVVPTAREYLSEMDRMYFHQEEPYPATSIFASYLVNRLASEHDVTVLLDGQGADEFLAGYAHYPAAHLSSLVRSFRFVSWWRERRATAERLGVDPVPPRSLPAIALRQLRPSDQLVDGLHNIDWVVPDFRAAHQTEAPRTIAAGHDALRARLQADLTMGHLQELLRYADRNAMAFSREPRLPFLDHRLVEFCATLPTAYLFHRGESKRVMRRALRGIVPDLILDRRDKVGFATPWQRWWEGAHALDLQARLRESEELLRDYVIPGRVAAGSRAALVLMSLASAVQSLRSLSRVAVGS